MFLYFQGWFPEGLALLFSCCNRAELSSCASNSDPSHNIQSLFLTLQHHLNECFLSTYFTVNSVANSTDPLPHGKQSSLLQFSLLLLAAIFTPSSFPSLLPPLSCTVIYMLLPSNSILWHRVVTLRGQNTICTRSHFHNKPLFQNSILLSKRWLKWEGWWRGLPTPEYLLPPSNRTSPYSPLFSPLADSPFSLISS